MLRRLRERLVDGHEDEVLAELADRHAPEAEKVATWRRYLVAYPNGRAASKAHWRLAEAALRADRDAEAEERLQRLLASFPERAEADAALVRLGRRFLDAERWERALELFAPFTDARVSARAETALIGVARANLGLRRIDEARALLRTYAQRFPAGARAAEAQCLARAIGDP